MRDEGGERGHRDRAFTRRAILLGLAELAGFTVIAGRLYQLQVMDGRRYGPLAEDNRLSLEVLPPRRGRILDRHGVPMAATEEGHRAVLHAAGAQDVPRLLEIVSQIVPIPAEMQAKISGRASSRDRSTPLVIAEDLTFDQVASLSELVPHVSGIEVETVYRRQYVAGSAVGHVAGYIGRVERHGLDDDPLLRVREFKVGKSGIERGMEKALRGVAGYRKFEVDARGRVVRLLEERPAEPGADVSLSIDQGLQASIYERLSSERRAACVAMDIATGEVVAMVSAPGYDPAVIHSGLSDSEWNVLTRSEDQPMLNRAIGGLYPPGSTFKMVTALAGLEAGAMTLSEEITCSGSYTLADQTYRCWKRGGHGRCNLHRALRESCDSYFYEIANRIGINRLAGMARRLGFGQTFASGIALQKPGVIPDSDWKRARFGTRWLGGETILAGIGQGFVLATPLHLAVMAARLASGTSVTPTLIRRDNKAGAPRFARLEIGQTGLDAVRGAMIASVNEPGGTGGNAILGPGLPKVAGKTGTAQVSRSSAERRDEDLPWEQRDHALFVAYFPAQAPRYALAAVVEHGGGGGDRAAPLVRDVIRLLIERDPVVAKTPLRRASGGPLSGTSGRS